MRKLQIAIFVLIQLGVIISLFLLSEYNYLIFHLTMETLMVILGLSIFILGLLTRNIKKDDFLFNVSFSLFITGVILFVHALTYQGMDFIPGYDSNLPTQLWIVAGYVQAITLVLGIILFEKKANQYIVLSSYFIISLALVILAFTGIFPDCFIEGSGLTLFKEISEYIIIFIFVIAFFLVARIKDKFSNKFFIMFSIALINFMVARFVFATYSDIFGFRFFLGHIFNLNGYIIMYISLLSVKVSVPLEEKFVDLSKHIDELENSIKVVTKSEQIFKSLYEESPLGYQSLDINGNFLLVNNAYLDLLGYKKEEMLGRNFGEFMDVSSMRRMPETFKGFLDTGEIDVIFDMIHKDGHSIPVRFLGKISRDEKGEFKQTHCILSDFTKILNYQKFLKDNEARFRLILNSTEEGIYGIDNNGLCTFVNKGFLKLLGYDSEEEVLGKDIHDLIHHTYSDGVTFPKQECDLIKAVTKGETIHLLDDVVWRKDGTSFNVEYSTKPQMKDEKIIGAVATFKDITQSKIASNMLKYEKNKAQRYLDVVGVMIIALDTSGNISLINEKGCEILGLEEDELIGMNWFDNFIPQAISEQVKEVFRNVFTKQVEFASQYENTIINAKGEERFIYWNNTILHDKDDNIIGIISSGQDITESKKASNKLIESEERLSLAHKIAKIGSWEYEVESRMMWGSKEAFEIYELDRTSEFLKVSFVQEMMSPKDVEKLHLAMVNLVDNNTPYNVEYKLNCKSGKTKYINSKATLILDNNGKPEKAIGVIHDITDLKLKELELEYAANNDFLTGLHNRRFYEDNLPDYDIEENYPLTIVMADINGLKLINDAFGHLAGDELLKDAAKVILNSCRKEDLIARIGGDEFVIVMPNTCEEDAEKIVGKINKSAELINIQSIPLSISFGYKTKNNISEDIQDVYRSAEDLMYREKLLEIPSMRSGAIETILSTLYEKDKNSEVHSRSVSLLSERIAKANGMNRQDIAEVKTAGLLHDIGKIVISLDIINKKGKLTPAEYETMKNHPEIGFRILNSTQDMRGISNIVLSHHERWDGKGYPRGITSKEIPLKSRIISIADAFDAMTSERTYREIFSNTEALKEIVVNAGTQFDPELAKVFEKNFDDIIKDL